LLIKNKNKKKCTIRILDEVTAVIVGLHSNHIEYFYQKYSEYINNYYFNPKVQLGVWDGKIHFFHKTGKTYFHLLVDIIPNIVAFGYSVNIDDQRKALAVDVAKIDKDYFHHIIEPDYNEPWVMRDYQVEMVNALIENGGGVGVAATASGKTCMAAALADSYEKAAGFKSIIIVPDKNLTNQTISDYEFFNLDVGEYSGTNKDLDHLHIVSTWQALQNNPTIIQSFQVVIVDECHNLRGNVIGKLLNEYGKNIAFRFGVTGTLPKGKADALAVRVSVGSVCCDIPAHKLITAGHLAKLHIDIMQLEVNLKHKYQEFLDEFPLKKLTYRQFRDSYFPDYFAEKSFLQGKKDRLDWISEYIDIKRNMGKGNVLCLVNGVRVGKKLNKIVPNSHFVYGKDKMKVRKEIYELFKNHDDIVVFATAKMAGTGLNIKRIFNLMFIDMGKSFIRIIQAIGRGLRKAPDKDFVHVTDICSDLKYSRKHLRERCNFYSEAKYPYKLHKVKS